MDESGEVQVECLMQRREIHAKDAKLGGVAVDSDAMAKERSIGRDTREKQEAQSK